MHFIIAREKKSRIRTSNDPNTSRAHKFKKEKGRITPLKKKHRHKIIPKSFLSCLVYSHQLLV